MLFIPLIILKPDQEQLSSLGVHDIFTSMINVQVKAKDGESTVNVLRRFSRRVSRAGIVHRKRSLKNRNRKLSKNVMRQQKIDALKKMDKVERLIKLGKLPDRRANYRGVGNSDK